GILCLNSRLALNDHVAAAMQIKTPPMTAVLAFQLDGWEYQPPAGDQMCFGYLWGAQVLTSRPRTRCLFLQPVSTAFNNRRPNSTQVSASLSSSSIAADSENAAQPPSSHRARLLEELPSPPVSAASTSAKLAALHARLSLPAQVPLQTLARTLVDPTADPDSRFNNESLSILGRDLLGYYTAEYLICNYPRLPMDVLFAAQAAYVGPKALATIAREWGVEAAAEPGGEVDPGLLQFRRVKPGFREDEHSIAGTGRPNEAMPWRRGISSRVVYDDEFGQLQRARATDPNEPPSTTQEDASKNFIRALIGVLQLHTGRKVTKQFFENHFLTRTLNLASLFDFRYPTRDLSRLCAREGFESPVARLISETGRASVHPVFVVGVYSGRDQLGQGVGSSVDEAKVRASAAALKAWYLYSPLEAVRPSEVEEGDPGRKWKPNVIDCGEIIT
ncbi:ribonuclease III, partial [Trichodelitschia bisporula]